MPKADMQMHAGLAQVFVSAPRQRKRLQRRRELLAVGWEENLLPPNQTATPHSQLTTCGA
jgi:hypothetical protein